MKPDCLVVGAGLIGLTTAYELARKGLSVTIVDRQAPGREASWAGAGVLFPLRPWEYPDAVVTLALAGARAYAGLSGSLYSATGIDPQYRRSGLLIRHPGERSAVQAFLAVYEGNAQWLGMAEQAEQFPELSADNAPALWFPEVAQIRNPRLLKALLRGLQQMAVVIRSDCKVTALQQQAGRVTGVVTGQGALSAGQVVLAAGAWTDQLLPEPLQRRIAPVRGQMLLLRGGQQAPQRLVLERDCYLVPRADGRVLVGSTTEAVGFDKRITATARNGLLQQALSLCPGLQGADIERQWSGLRPGSSDGLPQIGAHPNLEGLWLNTGHYRNGVAMAPASAQRLAALMAE